jgi:hypothetical protein
MSCGDGDPLTRPEKAAAFNHARTFVKSELAKGNACKLCLHRSLTTYWDRHVCALNHSRSFPLCMKDGREPSFDLDEKQVKGKIHG